MEQSDKERIDWLLNTIDTVLGDAQRNSDPEGIYVDFSTAYRAIAELRTLIEAE